MLNRLLYFLIAGFITIGAVSAKEIKVKTSGGTEKIEAVTLGDAYYYNFCQIDNILGGQTNWIRPGYTVEFRLDTSLFIFAAGSPYISLNGTSHSMIFPAKIIKGALYLPAETFTPLLNLACPENITWDYDGLTLRIDSEWFNITDLAIHKKQNGILIEIFMTSPLRFEIYESEGNWLNFDFPGGRINIDKINAAMNRQYLRKISAFQFMNSAQLSFRLKRSFENFHHTFKTNPGRLQVSVEDKSFEADSSLARPNRIGPDEKIDVVVIDPGHGGKDYGAIGRFKRTREKDITLEIARELAKMIRKDKQFKVIMTRTKDEYVSLDERAKIANDARADLFLSIHCNSSTKTSPHGSQIFYLAPANTDAARAVAQFENAPFLLEDPTFDTTDVNDLAFILNDMIQTEFITESADLAYMADIEMRKKTNIKSRGVDHAGFFVLNRVYMPSILVEAAFISNEKEEKLLRGKKFRKKVAEAIYETIKRFKAKYERI
jgi:N-acetylmuramoyl-L-alanine amidase